MLGYRHLGVMTERGTAIALDLPAAALFRQACAGCDHLARMCRGGVTVACDSR